MLLTSNREQRPALRVPQRPRVRARAIALQPAEIDPRLEIDPHPPRRRQLTVPVPTGIQIPGLVSLGPGAMFRLPPVAPRVDRPDADAEDKHASTRSRAPRSAACRAFRPRRNPCRHGPSTGAGRVSAGVASRALVAAAVALSAFCASSTNPFRVAGPARRHPCPPQSSFARRSQGDAMHDAGRTGSVGGRYDGGLPRPGEAMKATFIDCPPFCTSSIRASCARSCRTWRSTSAALRRRR